MTVFKYPACAIGSSFQKKRKVSLGARRGAPYILPMAENYDEDETLQEALLRQLLEAPDVRPLIVINQSISLQELLDYKNRNDLFYTIDRAYVRCVQSLKNSLRKTHLRNVRITVYDRPSGEWKYDCTPEVLAVYKEYRNTNGLSPNRPYEADTTGKLFRLTVQPFVSVSGGCLFEVKEFERFLGKNFWQTFEGQLEIICEILNYATQLESITMNAVKPRLKYIAGDLYSKPDPKSFASDYVVEEAQSCLISTYGWNSINMNCNMSYDFNLDLLPTIVDPLDGSEFPGVGINASDFKIQFRLESSRKHYTLAPHGDLKITKMKPLMHTMNRIGDNGVREILKARAIPVRGPVPSKRTLSDMKNGVPTRFQYIHFRLRWTAVFLPERVRRVTYFKKCRQFVIGKFLYFINKEGQLSRRAMKYQNVICS